MLLIRRYLILKSILLCVAVSVSAQELIHYDITDGLSSIEVNDVRENENYLWIATSDGLNRFDGRNFKIFKKEENSDNCLGENNIETLFFDSEGLLWIGLKTGGVDIYDPRHDKFSHLDKLINDSVPSRVISIAEDSEHNIWLGTWEQGVYKLTPEDRQRKHFRSEIHYSGYIVATITEKPEGYVRIGTYTGIFVYSLKENKWAETGLYNKAVTQFVDAGIENSIWCSTWSSGLIEVTWNDHHPEVMQIGRTFSGDRFRSIHRLLKTDNGKFYIGTWGEGMKIMDLTDPEHIFSLSNDKFKAPLINCLFRDRYNNIWIGAYGGGLYKFNPESRFIRTFPSNSFLSAPAVALADFDTGMIMLGTQGSGIFLCDLLNNRLIPKFKNKPDNKFSNYILSLYSGTGYIFTGHDGNGVSYLIKNQPLNTDFHFQEFPYVTQLEKATAFYQDQSGRIWIGTKQNGLFSVRYNTQTLKPGEIIHYDTFGRDEITGFASLNRIHLYISSHNGLYIFNSAEGKIENDGNIIRNELVYSIIRDNKNNCIWIGTSTRLLRIDLSDPQTVKEALPDDIIPRGAIRNLILDNANNLWFSVRDRLFCLNDAQKKIFEINQSVYDNKAILSTASTHVFKTEYLVFGTTDNLVLFDPAKVLGQSAAPGIIFSGLEIDHRRIEVGEKVHGQVVFDQSPEYIRAIRMSHKSRWISFYFVEKEWDLCKNKYQYRLKGFSDSWQYLDLSGPVTFSQLNPGRYTLEIRQYDTGEGADIFWSLEATVLPLWRNAAWFYILLALTFLMIMTLTSVVIVNYYRKRHILKLKEIEKQKHDELLREKESFFTSLSHDLMTPLSLIISPVNDLLRENPDNDLRKEKLEIISRNTSFLSDIFSTILDFKRVEINDNQMKETMVEIVSFSRMVLNAFEYLAKSRRITLSFNSSTDRFKILTDNIKVERILYNLLSNSIKFTPDGGNVSLTLNTVQKGRIIYTIADNGCGIDLRNHDVFEKFYSEPGKASYGNAHGLGLGLYIVKEFVRLLGGDILVNSSPGEGTGIIVSIPYKSTSVDDLTISDRNLMPMDEDLSTILIVEDNDEMREYISRKLSSNFNVIQAGNGNEALRLVEKYIPEIIITDVMMPEMDGLALCRMIKENNRYSDLFVVMLSARTSTEDELQAYKSGVDIYIKKPLDSEVLLNQMINIHATRQRRKSQLLANLLSDETPEIKFDSKETFIKKAMQVIEEYIMDADFKIDHFAAEMNMSNTVLHRKFKLFIGTTPNQFIRLVRLRKSVSLLRNTDHTIAEIASLTGFNQSHYFIKCFREVYNETPGNYRDKNRPDSSESKITH